jgi:Ni/Fe-hydrogenase subunit HybB-like protein
MGEFLIFGIPAAALVVILVQVLKAVIGRTVTGDDGLPIWKSAIQGPVSILCALGIGLVLAGLNYIAQVIPGFAQIWEVIGMGLIAGLTAAGFYSGQKALRGQ